MVSRPKWVWVITVWYGVSGVWTLLSMAMVQRGVVQLKATERAFLDNMEVFDWLGAIVGAALTCVAVYLLFRLRKSAVVAFGALLLLNAALWAIYFLRKGFTQLTQVLSPPIAIGLCFGLGMLLSVFLYARRLRDQGALT